MGGPGRYPWRYGPPGSGDHRAMFRRFRRFMGLMMVLTVLLPVLLAGALTAAFAGWTGAAAAAVLSLAVVVVGVLLGRFLFRGFRSVNELVEATGRLADGDYTARIVSESPPAFGPMIGAFNRMAERLEQSDDQRRRLLADVGHELRTPLTIIRGELEAMVDGVHELRESELRRLLVDVDGMERLLDDLKTLSTTEAGVLALHPEPTDVGRLVSDTVARFEAEAHADGVDLVVDVPSTTEPPVVAEVDSMRIGEVVTNLVTNALRAVDSGGRIDVWARTTGEGDGDIEIMIRDNGAGIAADQLPTIFDRFAKGRDSNGSGLGLTISRSLVEAHAGTIEADSTPGQGTTMTVRLPKAG